MLSNYNFVSQLFPLTFVICEKADLFRLAGLARSEVDKAIAVNFDVGLEDKINTRALVFVSSEFISSGEGFYAGVPGFISIASDSKIWTSLGSIAEPVRLHS